jgi:hypothetical protein
MPKTLAPKKPTLPRGFTTQSLHSPETRPPNLQGRVYNEFRPEVARGSTMPPPTGDTEEPRLSQRTAKKRK